VTSRLEYRVSTRSLLFVDSLSQWGAKRTMKGGSFGMVVEDLIPQLDDPDTRLILTAAHVCGSLSPAGPGHTRVLHSTVGASQDHGRPLGEVRRCVPEDDASTVIPIDAAVIKPYPDVSINDRVGQGRTPAGCRDLLTDPPNDLIVVHKDGATTGRTTGLLEPVVVADQTVTRHYTQGWWIIGENDRPFAQDGDSGSIVLDEDGAAVGMVVAVDKGNPPLTFCHALAPILQALSVKVPGD
jgi:hypothetical protein